MAHGMPILHRENASKMAFILKDLVLHYTRSPTVRRTFDVGDVTNQPAWSCFVTEDARESMRSLRFAFLSNLVDGRFVCHLLFVI